MDNTFYQSHQFKKLPSSTSKKQEIQDFLCQTIKPIICTHNNTKNLNSSVIELIKLKLKMEPLKIGEKILITLKNFYRCMYININRTCKKVIINLRDSSDTGIDLE